MGLHKSWQEGGGRALEKTGDKTSVAKIRKRKVPWKPRNEVVYILRKGEEERGATSTR